MTASDYVPTAADLQRRYELLVYMRAVRPCPRCGAQRPVAEFVDLLGRMCRGCRDRLAQGASYEDGRGMGEGKAANGSRAAGHITEKGTSREVGSPRPTTDATAALLEVA